MLILLRLLDHYILKPNKAYNREELAVLKQELVQGSVEAYSTIYRYFYNRLFRYAIQICEQAPLAEDVLQDFFTYLAEHYRKLRKVNNLEVYLFQSIKRNVVARLSREKQHRLARDRYQWRTEPLRDTYEPPPDQLLIGREEGLRRQELIRGEMAKLPDHQREILYLRYYEDLSYEEICQIVGLSNQVARNYAGRAIRKLKEALLNTACLITGLLVWMG